MITNKTIKCSLVSHILQYMYRCCWAVQALYTRTGWRTIKNGSHYIAESLGRLQFNNLSNIVSIFSWWHRIYFQLSLETWYYLLFHNQLKLLQDCSLCPRQICVQCAVALMLDAKSHCTVHTSSLAGNATLNYEQFLHVPVWK